MRIIFIALILCCSLAYADIIIPSGSGTITIPKKLGSEILRPNGVGSLSQCYVSGDTPGWKCVDEVTSDGDGTFVYAIDITLKSDLYTLSDHTGLGTINKVTIYAVVRESLAAGVAWLQILIKSGTTTDVSTVFILSTVYSTKSNEYTVNPATSQPWTWEEIDALERGITIWSQTGYGNALCTQVWAVVESTGGTVTISK